MQDSRVLPTLRLPSGTALPAAHPSGQAPVTRDSPALAVMTDLTQVRAASTQPGTTLREAEQVMIYTGVRLLFVVSRMPALEGLITTTDLHGDRAMRLVQERGLRYDDLVVADVMTELARLDAIDLRTLRGATVGDAIATLQRFGRNHLLVVDTARGGEPPRVHGLISRAQIERQLGQPVVITPIASSFSEVERALAEG